MAQSKWPKRRRMREILLMSLYSVDPMSDWIVSDLEALINCASEEGEPITPRLRTETLRFAQGILEHILPIDQAIQNHLMNWSWERIAMVDRTVLRIAVYEFFYEDDIPIEVTINEAVEIAKKYGSEKSGGFVNGILNSVARDNVSQEKWALSPKLSGGETRNAK